MCAVGAGSTIAKRLSRLLTCAAFALAGGCAGSQTDAKPPCAPSPNAPPPTFELDREGLLQRGASPALVGKLEASRFRYFRMLAEPFEQKVCRALEHRSNSFPVSAVHGDAHVEQFVVTADTYGLEDFDRSGMGPPALDVVRYAASLHVACSDVAWPCDADAAVDRFLSTWRDALEKRPEPRKPPAVVERIRAKAPASREAWLAWADGLMVPLPPPTESAVKREWQHFADAMRGMRPDTPTGTFDVVRVGSLSMGFGSALEQKFLLRIAGPTPAPDDDRIVEAREGASPPSSQSCVWRPSYGESLILMFTAIMSRRMPDIHGFVPLLGGPQRFWLQDWDPGYQELSLRDLQSQAELEELAIDAAEQLGGHAWSKFPEILLRSQMPARREAFDASRPELIELSRELAAESNAAWERFRGGGAAAPVNASR